PAQQVDIEVVRAILGGRPVETELDQVMLGPVVPEAEPDVPRVLEDLFAFRLLESQVSDVRVELPGFLAVLRPGCSHRAGQAGKREHSSLHPQATHQDPRRQSVRIPLQEGPRPVKTKVGGAGTDCGRGAADRWTLLPGSGRGRQATRSRPQPPRSITMEP